MSIERAPIAPSAPVLPRPGTARGLAPALLALTGLGLVGVILWSWAGSGPKTGVLATMLKWFPLVFSGFLLNLLVSVLSMVLGTALGVALGLAQVSLHSSMRRASWLATQFFRNAPWLVLLFYAMLILPFEVQVFGWRVPLPGWLKSVIGLSLPVMANVSEIVRGGVQSIPVGQWESAESLAFSRRQILWSIILPQAVKRMIPPWMNLYAILTMATSLISIVGVQDGVSLTRAALVAEGRTELFMPMYLMLLMMFFAYCYPIARLTAALERRYVVRT